MLDNESKKSLRAASQYFLALSRKFEKEFLKYLMFDYIYDDKLELMSDQVHTVKGNAPDFWFEVG